MGLESDKIKDLFSSKLNNFEPDVPASVWSGIDLLLPQTPPSPAPNIDPSSSISSASGTVSPVTSIITTVAKVSLVKTIAVVTSLAAAVTLAVTFVPELENNTEPNSETEIVQIVSISDSLSIDSLEAAHQDTAYIAYTTKNTSKRLYSTSPAKLKPVQEWNYELELEEEGMISEEGIKPNKAAAKNLQIELPVEEEELPVIKKAKGKLTIGLGGNIALLGYNSMYKGADFLLSQDVRSKELKSALNKQNDQAKLQHSQPISLGITVSKPITPYLAIETGLVYTRLSSSLVNTGTGLISIDETQRFDYLGIPLSFNYALGSLGKTNFFLSLGGMVQKDVRGYFISNLNIDNSDDTEKGLSDLYYSEPYYVRKSIKQSDLQFSVHSSLGVSYPIYKKVSLYGTFGGAYFFDANNLYRTIYSDRKTQLDLNVGVKFGL